MIASLTLPSLLPFVLGGVLFLGALLFLYFALRSATDGSEDDTGFHHRTDGRVSQKLP